MVKVPILVKILKNRKSYSKVKFEVFVGYSDRLPKMKFEPNRYSGGNAFMLNVDYIKLNDLHFRRSLILSIISHFEGGISKKLLEEILKKVYELDYSAAPRSGKTIAGDLAFLKKGGAIRRTGSKGLVFHVKDSHDDFMQMYKKENRFSTGIHYKPTPTVEIIPEGEPKFEVIIDKADTDRLFRKPVREIMKAYIQSFYLLEFLNPEFRRSKPDIKNFLVGRTLLNMIIDNKKLSLLIGEAKKDFDNAEFDDVKVSRIRKGLEVCFKATEIGGGETSFDDLDKSLESFTLNERRVIEYVFGKYCCHQSKLKNGIFSPHQSRDYFFGTRRPR